MPNKHLYKFFLFLFLIFIFCECQQDKLLKNYTSDKIHFSIYKEVHLPLDSLSQPSINYYQILQEDTLKFMFFNGFNNSLYMYDFKKGKLLKKISLTFEDGILPKIDAFYYINKDSILLFPEYGDYYLICDYTGKIYPHKLKFVDTNNQNKIESHWITSSNPIIKIQNNIYINNVFSEIAEIGDDTKYLMIEYNLFNKSSNFFIKHPASIYGKNYDSSTFRHMYFTQKMPNRCILYSFGFDPYVYEYCGDKKNIKTYYCAPKNYNLPDGLSKNMSSNDKWIHFQTNFSFSKMTFDPFKNVLLRVGLKPYRLEDIKDGIIYSEVPKKPKIYVFDANSDYHLLGEIDLDSNKNYYFINMFATEEGIWIQKIIDDEDVMCFELISYNP